MKNDRWILYGATGFTGELIAAAAHRRGLRPVLAGRSESKLAALASRFGFEHLSVSLDQPEALRQAVRGAAVVLHAAGPFVDTSLPMVEACLAEGASYLDITGELPVFQQTFRHDAAAREKAVALISGVGFDVVPTDCLARFVAEQTPGATSLEVAIMGLGETSAGTRKSAIGIIAQGGLVRRGGQLRQVPFGRGAKQLRFPPRQRWAVPGPLADLETAWHTTGIPEITTYLAVGSGTARTLGRVWPLVWALHPALRAVVGLRPVEARLRRWVEQGTRGPDAASREKSRCYAWARAESATAVTEATLTMKDPYEYTAEIALDSVLQLLERPGQLRGALTPAQAFGADFALQVEGTLRELVPAPR
ncbi:MAG: saccharopine dehydrogenase NADP-binding domain-containing protein [Myxococcota bacterium]|nr:saccharopine dehydrogenase NADP-binding domain-containing protein [Myxococcota bacterium]